MKTANYLNIEDEENFNEVFLQLADNGDWEYTRLGFGEDSVGLYIVDLDDTGEEFREKFRVKSGLSVEDVLHEGVLCGVFEKFEEGDHRGTHGVRVDDTAGDFQDFLDIVVS